MDKLKKTDKVVSVKTYVKESPESADSPAFIVVDVTDNGEGISKDVMGKIFQPFFTTREVGEGTGLGLSVANKIIQEHKGRIELESEIGKGTTFRVLLPAVVASFSESASG
jgi:two-component system NtrC family sensor kinase